MLRSTNKSMQRELTFFRLTSEPLTQANTVMEKEKFKENGIHYRRWASNDDVRGIVLIVHGLGEHCERYDAIANAFNHAGYGVCSLDLPGHGLSDGRRGHINSFNDYTSAVLALYEKIKTWYPNQSIYLFGHSMGGLIAAQLLLNHQEKFAGAMLSGAALQSPQQPPAFQVAIIKIISVLFPRLGMLVLDASGISRDPAVVEKYLNDPLINKGKLSARLLVQMFATMDECIENARTINLPILIMHGSKDPMTDPTGSQALFNNIASRDKELKIYDGVMHEILNEPEGPEITHEMIDWMERH